MKKRFISLIALSAIVAPALQSCDKEQQPKYTTKIYCDKLMTTCGHYDSWTTDVSTTIKTAKSIQIIQVQLNDGTRHFHYAVTWEN